MPRGNQTGPMGMGPMTGRGMGPCGGGMAYWRRAGGGGRGFGWRRFWGYYPAPSVDKKEEVEILYEEAEVLEEELKAVKARLEEIKNQK